MKMLVCLILLIAIVYSDAFSQRSNTTGSSQYAFVMVIDKEGTKLNFSSVFSLKVDKRGSTECDLSQLEIVYRKAVADEKFDVILLTILIRPMKLPLQEVYSLIPKSMPEEQS